jgi:hypothetical protein
MLGDVGWNYAADKDDEERDSLNDKSKYGYATANKGDYDSIANGAYEFKVGKLLYTVEGAHPMEFNHFSDSPITDIFDCKVPKLHGLPTPNNMQQSIQLGPWFDGSKLI